MGNFTFLNTSNSKSVVDLAFCTFPFINHLINFQVPESFSTSDHLPILITINSSCLLRRTPPRRYIKWKESASTSYNAVLRASLSSLPPITTTNQHAETLRLAMVSAADGLGMIRTTRVNNHPPWFNSDCREKKRALRSAFRRRRRQNFDQQSLLDLSEARLQFAQALRDAESSYNQLMLHNIINSRSQLELWSAIRKVTGAKNTNSTDLTTASVTNHFLSLFDKFPTNITFNAFSTTY